MSSARTEGLFVSLTLLPLGAFVWRTSLADLDGWSAFLLAVAAFFLFYAFNYRTLVVRLGAGTLRLRFGLFKWTVPLANIESCVPDPVPLWRIGGAGIHFTSIHGRYRAMFNFLEHPRLVVGLRVKRGLVRDVVFSTRKQAEWMALLAPDSGSTQGAEG